SPAGLAYLAGIASVFAATGRDDEARRASDIVAADDFATVPRDMNWLSTIASAAEVCATLGDPQRARTVRSLLERYAELLLAHDDTGRGLQMHECAAAKAKAAGLERTVELISTQGEMPLIPPP